MEMRRPKPSPGREPGSITWHQVQKGKETWQQVRRLGRPSFKPVGDPVRLGLQRGNRPIWKLGRVSGRPPRARQHARTAVGQGRRPVAKRRESGGHPSLRTGSKVAWRYGNESREPVPQPEGAVEQDRHENARRATSSAGGSISLVLVLIASTDSNSTIER
jgi:hypothetical protein